jgi:hypothetical protein
MVRMPIIPEGWLDGGQSSGTEDIAPANAGGNTSTAPKSPIGPVQGYPEDGQHAWRAANDDAIVDAVGRHNASNKLFPGDSAYMTPKLMKAWMMRESGGTPDAFRTDPFQTNNVADWPNTGRDKERVLGLSKGQEMTPQTSADAALKWLQHRGTIHDARGNPVTYVGHHRALELYNAEKGMKNGLPAYADYASSIMNNAWASYGDWQQ